MSLVFITHQEDCPESSKQIRKELKNEDEYKETKRKKNADIVICGITSEKVLEMGKKKLKSMMTRLEREFSDKTCVFFITHISDDDDEDPIGLCNDSDVNYCVTFEDLGDFLEDSDKSEEETEESEEETEESEDESEEDSGSESD